MASSLLELVESYLTPDAISKISKLVGETPDSTHSALRAIAPSLTAAACHQASTPSGAALPLVMKNITQTDCLSASSRRATSVDSWKKCSSAFFALSGA